MSENTEATKKENDQKVTEAKAKPAKKAPPRRPRKKKKRRLKKNKVENKAEEPKAAEGASEAKTEVKAGVKSDRKFPRKGGRKFGDRKLATAGSAALPKRRVRSRIPSRTVSATLCCEAQAPDRRRHQAPHQGRSVRSERSARKREVRQSDGFASHRLKRTV